MRIAGTMPARQPVPDAGESLDGMRCADTMRNCWPGLVVCGLALFAVVARSELGRVDAVSHTSAQGGAAVARKAILGFDRNEYPGDQNLATLRRTFSFSVFWLNSPPGTSNNSWIGKRNTIKQAGFGFLVLFNGRLDAELRKAAAAKALGRSDAVDAVAAARREGFPQGTIIFLDLEEGGRMLPEQKAYLYAWVDGVNGVGYRAGIYCSGIAAAEGAGVTVVTAEDIRQNAQGRPIVYWVAQDRCPPSPGCAFPKRVPQSSESGIKFAEVWQFAQSPRRPDFARRCSNYARDGNCYAPGLDADKLFVDLDAASSADPSAGR